MASPTILTVVHRSLVSPPPQSVPPTVLPLTFFDIPWLLFTPTQPLFFYHYPTTTTHFTQFILPNLNHALSLALHHFFPFAGKLDLPPPPAAPTLQYSDEDAVTVTVAEAAGAWAAEFHNICGNQLKASRDFHCLVPELRSTGFGVPLLAVQFTVFPGAGICVGFTLRHVTADLRTFNNFLKTWASAAAAGNGISKMESIVVATHDRSVIRDPASRLAQAFLREWWSIVKTGMSSAAGVNIEAANLSPYDPTTRATFVITPKEMERIKKWILDRSESLFGTTRILLSPYVLTCAFVWACWIRTRWSGDNQGGQTTHYLGFIAGGATRLGYVVPGNYVGNCVGFGRAAVGRREVLGENGVAYAAKSLGDTIERLNGDMLGGSENWMSEWKAIREWEGHVMVTGSPKVDLYGRDLGFGRPVKIEEVSIDTTGAISLCEGRDVGGSIEIGVALPKSQLEYFTSLFTKGLY